MKTKQIMSTVTRKSRIKNFHKAKTGKIGKTNQTHLRPASSKQTRVKTKMYTMRTLCGNDLMSSLLLRQKNHSKTCQQKMSQMKKAISCKTPPIILVKNLLMRLSPQKKRELIQKETNLKLNNKISGACTAKSACKSTKRKGIKHMKEKEYLKIKVNLQRT